MHFLIKIGKVYIQVTEIDLNSVLISDSDKIADSFNEYFSNFGPTLADNRKTQQAFR